MYKLFINIFCVLLPIQLFSQNDSIIAVRELQKLNYTFGYRAQMEIVRNGNIVSLPNETIKLNINEIDNIVSSQNEIVRTYVVRFIIAHEFAHQIQYYAYRNNSTYMSNDLISRTVIETQADILGSLMLWYVNFELYDYINSNPYLLNQIIEELLQVAIEIGSKEHTIGTHPSKRDRALAFRLGLTNGLSYVYDQRVKANPAANIQKGLTPELFKQQMNYILEFVDIRDDKDFLPWSYRQAKKILNYDRKISTDLVLVTPSNKRHTFHTSQTYPYVDYDLTYKNIGSKIIDIDMEVFISLVNRENPNSAKSYRKLNVNHYTFSLSPNETHTIQGRLRWDKGENDFLGLFAMTANEIPRIIYPSINSLDAIYSCVYTEKEYQSKVYQENIKFLNLSEDDESIDFPIYVNSVLNSCLIKDKDIIQGIGERNFNIENTLFYNCSLQFNEDTKTTVMTDLQKNISRVELEFPNFYPHSYYVPTNYKKLKNVLDSEFPNCTKEEGHDSDGSCVTYSCDSYKVYLEGFVDEQEKDYSIYFRIDLNE